jgi:alpha-mannosidase
LHRLFGALEEEINAGRMVVPEYSGELNFALRGVNSAGAKFKFPYRRAEASLERAERAVRAAGIADALPSEMWRGMMFNTFHDILPATCTENALEQQIDEVRGLSHAALVHERDALVALAQKLDPHIPAAPGPDQPQAVPFVVWNPLDRPWSGLVEVEACLDHRPLFGVSDPELRVLGVDGEAQPFQQIAFGHNFIPFLTWRRRVLTRVDLPALGAGVVSLGWVPGHSAPALPADFVSAQAAGENGISNGWFTVTATPGEAGLSLQASGNESAPAADWLSGITLLSVEDPWGPWGGHWGEEVAHALNAVRHTWKIVSSAVIESGPLRSILAVKFQSEGGASEAEFTIQLEAGRRAITVAARVFWTDENARLKLVFPVGAKRLELEVPGGTVQRGEVGEGPGIGWVRALQSQQPFALSTDVLSDFDLHQGAVQATVVRSSHYTQSEAITSTIPIRGPVIDRGEYRFRFVLTDTPADIENLSQELRFPPSVQMTFARTQM